MTHELKPCPFCGLLCIRIDERQSPITICCDGCGARVTWHGKTAKGYVVGQWNGRSKNDTAAPRRDDELAGLEREIAEGFARSWVETSSFGGWASGTIHPTLVRYLELRGLLERHPDQPNLVRVRD